MDKNRAELVEPDRPAATGLESFCAIGSVRIGVWPDYPDHSSSQDHLYDQFPH